MRVVVRLAGESLPWRFKDADRLGNWIDTNPWNGTPQVRLLRVSDLAAADHLHQSVADAVAAADRKATGVEPAALDPELVAADGFVAAAARYLGIPLGATPLESAGRIGRNLECQPLIWIVPPLPRERPQAIVETETFVDLLHKLNPAARHAVLFTDTLSAPLGGRCFDLSTGGPASATDLLAVSEDRLWSHYLHRRIAWESGGRYAAALRLSEQLDASPLRTGDDGGVEATFNHEAERTYAGLSSSLRSKLDHALDESVESGRPVDRELADFFWNPGHLFRILPVPWLARAMLLSNASSRFAGYLRTSLLVLPVCQELLTACFLMETQIRGRIQLPDEPPSDADCHSHWRDFEAQTTISAALYPPCGPSRPTDAWAFASLGEVLKHEIVRPFGDDWRHQVRLLRNHLAHGHYAGWEAIRLARRLASLLAGY